MTECSNIGLSLGKLGVTLKPSTKRRSSSPARRPAVIKAMHSPEDCSYIELELLPLCCILPDSTSKSHSTPAGNDSCVQRFWRLMRK